MAIIDDNWNYRVDIKSDGCKEFESRVSELRYGIINLNGLKAHIYDFNEISTRHDEELKILIEKNKQLCSEIDKKLDEVSKQKSQYQNFKQDQQVLSQEIKDTHEAFLMAKKYYKKYLKMYYTIESENNNLQTIFLQFFTDVKKEPEKYSVRLVRNTETEHYKLVDTNPKLKTVEELKNILQDTNDVPSVLCSIRQTFHKMKKNKKT